MNLDNYIYNLLEKEESFSIPGLGTFETKPDSASVHPIDSKIVPPSKKITINSDIISDDGKLSTIIAEKEGVTEEQFQNIISEFVSLVKNSIEKTGGYEIAKVGKLYYNPEQKLEFKPLNKDNFLEDSFGLPDIDSKPIGREKVTDRPAKKLPKEDKRSAKGDEQPRKNKKFAALWALVPLVVLLGIGTFLYKNKGNDNLNSQNTFGLLESQGNDKGENTGEVVVVVETQVSDKIESENVEEYTTSSENSKNGTESVEHSFHEAAISGSQGAYSIIIGSFVNQQNAVDLKNKIEEQGKNSLIIEPDGGSRFYRVSVAEFNNEDAAKNSLNQFKAEYGNSVWIMSK